ncbi:MAG: sulfotransferase family protein [Myxococcales bacterium]|nr:sulfotransferase family protein [Myxococcales bacterium]
MGTSTLKIIGAGFGRTGTLSLKLALEQLGFGPCYHMFEVFQNPGHAELWSRAGDGDIEAAEQALAGFQSAVDWPAIHFWRQLAERHPEAKVLLSVREPARWFKSANETIFASMAREPDGKSPVAGMQEMARKLIREQAFGGDFFPEAHAIEVFERHNAEVQRVIEPERLLVYEVSQGWGPLCAFLNRSVPDTEFPRTNSTAEFRRGMGLEGQKLP